MSTPTRFRMPSQVTRLRTPTLGTTLSVAALSTLAAMATTQVAGDRHAGVVTALAFSSVWCAALRNSDPSRLARVLHGLVAFFGGIAGGALLAMIAHSTHTPAMRPILDSRFAPVVAYVRFAISALLSGLWVRWDSGGQATAVGAGLIDLSL